MVRWTAPNIGGSGGGSGIDGSFDNTGTNLTSTTLQDAIVEVNEKSDIITTTPYILSGPENTVAISLEGVDSDILEIIYDSAEVDENNIVVETRLSGGQYAPLNQTTTWEQAIRDWKLVNVTTEKYYVSILLPAQAGVTEYSAIIKHKE